VRGAEVGLKVAAADIGAVRAAGLAVDGALVHIVLAARGRDGVDVDGGIGSYSTCGGGQVRSGDMGAV